MITATIKIGLNKGKRRIWLEGKRLLYAGFIGGTTYKCEVSEGLIELSLNGDDRKVTGRPNGNPIIDIIGRDVESAFPTETHVFVRFYDSGTISIRPAQSQQEAA